MTIQDVLDLMAELAPLHLAADWDNCGLQVGDPSRPLKGVAIAVDPTFEAVQEAIFLGASLLITHHPLLFKAAKRLDLRSEPGRTIEALIKYDVALYSAHTNLDATAVNVALAKAIGLLGHSILQVQGHYPSGEAYGFGLVGDLETPLSLQAFAERVKGALKLPNVRFVGPALKPIRRVAWLGGSGGDYFKDALKAGADAYITGEVRHHAALDALAAGLCFIEVGHVGSEQPVVPYLAEFLRESLGVEYPIHPLLQHDPFVVV
jgi:dinuclear metal center YbgI/SA1388 family protein